MINSTIAHYRITAKLGQGGMGEVYRATDARLGREVAIKILPGEFAAHPERLARFEREAKSLAQLNHANIGSIFGFDQHEGKWFLVLELIEGEDLSARLKRGPLPMQEVLPTFQQIAEALEAAHAKNIVHRDLKPANIKVDSQGRVKVLDFGLAKARLEGPGVVDGEAMTVDAIAPTMTAEFTEPGKVMGTVAYMSPEQARGQEVDRRTDVWAFGCCLYEALTGQKPFKGQTLSDVMAEILRSDPDFTLVPPDTPPEIRRLLLRCLEKEPQRRLRDLGDIAITLEDVTETSRRREAVAPVEVNETPRTKVIPSWGWGTTSVFGIVATMILGLMLLRQVEAPVSIRSLAVVPFQNLKTEDSDSQYLATTLQQALKEQLGTLESLDIKAEGSASVDATVRGTFVRVDDRYHVTVSMIEERSQSEKPLGSYTSSVTNIFPLQDKIATAVGERIRKDLTEQERKQIAAERHIDPRAYIAYRRGFELYWTDDARIDEAISEFTKAIDLDPNFVDPMVLLADAQWWPNTVRKTTTMPLEWFERAKAQLAKAIQLAPNHSRVLWQQGYIAMGGDWDWKNAQHFMRKSLLNNPEEADFYEGYAVYKVRIEGDFDHAHDLITSGLKLDPENAPLRNFQAYYFFHYGDYEKALTLLNRNVAQNSNNLDVRLVTAKCLIGLGKLSQAREVIEQAIILSEGHPEAHLLLAKILALSNDPDGAKSILERIEEQRKTIYVSPMAIAEVYAAMNDWDETFRLLEKAYAHGSGWRLTNLRTHYLLASLGDQPRYWDLVDRMNFPALPIQHPFHEKEQRMRFGKIIASTAP